MTITRKQCACGCGAWMHRRRSDHGAYEDLTTFGRRRFATPKCRGSSIRKRPADAEPPIEVKEFHLRYDSSPEERVFGPPPKPGELGVFGGRAGR